MCINCFQRTPGVKDDGGLHAIKDNKNVKKVGEIYPCKTKK